MGMSSDEVNRIYYIGLVHDIGKIGISDQIINKQERLTKEEYETTKAHPEIGAKILQNISEMPEQRYLLLRVLSVWQMHMMPWLPRERIAM